MSRNFGLRQKTPAQQLRDSNADLSLPTWPFVVALAIVMVLLIVVGTRYYRIVTLQERVLPAFTIHDTRSA